MELSLKLVQKNRHLLGFAAGLFVLIVALWLPKHVFAWANGKGQDFSQATLTSKFFSDNFIFTDTQTITDKGLGQAYVTASIPAFDLSNNDNNDWFMFWPTSGSGNSTPLDTPIGSVCRGGLLVQMAGGNTNVKFIVPNIDPSGSGKCILNNHPLSYYTGNLKDKKDDIKNFPAGGETMLNLSQLQVLASPFYWTSKDTLAVAGWGGSNVIIDSKHPGALSKIQADLGRHTDWGSVKDLGNLSTISYYANGACFNNDKQAYIAFIAVRSDKKVAHVFHYNDADPNKDVEDNWKDDQQQCLFSNKIYSHNPGSEALGQGKSDTLVYLTHLASANADPTAQQLDDINKDGFQGDQQQATDPDFQCHSDIPVLGWFICEIIKSLANGTTAVNNAITSALNLDVNDYFGANGSSVKSTSNYKLWSRFRDIALSLLVVVAMVMVISQAFDFGPFDAYTIKKVLPRIFVAAILITLSWELGRFFVQLSNDLGEGVKQILTSVAPGDIKLSLDAGSSGALAVGAIAAGVAATTLSFVAVLTLLGTALLAATVAYVIIIFRQLLLVVCVVTSPIAFVAFILPNTEKVWKIWKDTFEGAILIFPMIMGVIYTGRLLASVQSPNGGSDLPSNIVVLVLYFGPYFLIPATLKAASGLAGTLTGMVNDRGRGAFDRLKNKRHEEMGKNWQKTKGFSRLSDKTAFGRGVNTALGSFAAGPKAWTRKGGINAARETGRALYGADFAENDRTFKANKNNDQFLLATANEKMAEDKRQAALASGDTASAQAWGQAIGLARQVNKNPAARMAALQSLAATGYQFGAGQEGYNQLAETVAGITGATLQRDADGNVTGATGARAGDFSNAMNSAQYNLKNAGRFDLAGINNGGGYDAAAGIGKVDPYTMASRAKPETIKTKGRMMRESLARAVEAQGRGDTATYNREMENAQVHRIELDAAKDSATGKNKDTILAELDTISGVSEINSWAAQSTGQTATRRVNYVAGSPGAAGWAPEEVARGWRMETVDVTRGEVARSKARGGRRPNPAELEE